MSKQHWSDYWQMGLLTSLPNDFKQNYDGELEDYWQEVVVSVADDARVLDLCTGNGAIAILLKEISSKLNKQLKVTAIDASDINPAAILQKYPEKKDVIKSIDFIADCYVENIADVLETSYDLIVSQYGVEYCDTAKAASSIYNSLSNNGQFVFIAHSPDTAMLEYMRIEEQVFQLLEDVGVFDSFKKFSLNKLSNNGFKNKLEKNLKAISQSELKTHTLLNTWGQNMYQLFQMNNDVLKQQREQAGHFLNQYVHARSRANDMLNVSAKLQDPNWVEPFKEIGLILKEEGQIQYQLKHNVGHFYKFYKP